MRYTTVRNFPGYTLGPRADLRSEKCSLVCECAENTCVHETCWSSTRSTYSTWLRESDVMLQETPALHTPLVLIASGDEWLARSLESMLTPNGIAVVKAMTGRQALEYTKSTRPD